MFLHDVRTVSVAIILAALVGGVTPMAALSQTSGQPSLSTPKQLKPSERARSGEDKESKTHSVYRAHPVDRPLSGIQVNPLGTMGLGPSNSGHFGLRWISGE